MSHTHPKELLQLVETPEYNRDFIRSWHPDYQKMVIHIIRDSTLLGARDWYLARDLETALTSDCPPYFRGKLERNMVSVASSGRSNPVLSIRAETVHRMLMHLSGEEEPKFSPALIDRKWEKAWQKFTEMAVTLNGETEFSLSEPAVECVSNYFGIKLYPDAPEMSQREINNHIKTVFNKERELMRASKES